MILGGTGLAVAARFVLVMAIDTHVSGGPVDGPSAGADSPPAPYVLILLPHLHGLMRLCFARSGIRQHWHVYGVIRDTSPEAFTPALGYAANVISVVTAVFFALVLFIFWLGSLGETETAEVHAPAPAIAGGAERT